MKRSPGPGAKTTVVRGRATFRLAVVSVALLGGGSMLGFLLTHQNSGAYVGGAIIAVICWLIWSIGISSKVTVSDDGIRVDNFFVSHILSWKDFDSFVLDSGMWLKKRDGSQVWLIGFGGSLIGALTGYRSMRKALVILQEAAKKHSSAAGSYVSRDAVRLGLPVLAGWILALQAALLVGRALH